MTYYADFTKAGRKIRCLRGTDEYLFQSRALRLRPDAILDLIQSYLASLYSSGAVWPTILRGDTSPCLPSEKTRILCAPIPEAAERVRQGHLDALRNDGHVFF